RLIGLLLKEVPLAEGRDWSACPLVDLQGPDDAVGVMGVQTGSSSPVYLLQAPIDMLPSRALSLGLQARPDRGVYFATPDQPRGQGLDIKSSATHDQCLLSLRTHLGDGLPRLLPEQGSAKFFIRVEDVNEVMPYYLPLFVRGLGRADVHVSVDLHRVGVDDLGPDVLRQLQGRRALPAGSRADYHHDLGLFHRPESKLPMDFLQGENRGAVQEGL